MIEWCYKCQVVVGLQLISVKSSVVSNLTVPLINTYINNDQNTTYKVKNLHEAWKLAQKQA